MQEKNSGKQGKYQVNLISVSASNTTDALKKALLAELKINPKIFFVIT